MDHTSILSGACPVPQVLSGHEYQITGSLVLEHDGQTLNGVLVAADGRAYAGHVTADYQGEFVSVALTEDGMLPALSGWETAILRDLAPARQQVAA